MLSSIPATSLALLLVPDFIYKVLLAPGDANPCPDVDVLSPNPLNWIAPTKSPELPPVAEPKNLKLASLVKLLVPFQ